MAISLLFKNISDISRRDESMINSIYKYNKKKIVKCFCRMMYIKKIDRIFVWSCSWSIDTKKNKNHIYKVEENKNEMVKDRMEIIVQLLCGSITTRHTRIHSSIALTSLCFNVPRTKFNNRLDPWNIQRHQLVNNLCIHRHVNTPLVCDLHCTSLFLWMHQYDRRMRTEVVDYSFDISWSWMLIEKNDC